MPQVEKIKKTNAVLFLLIFGAIFVIFAFISEINFHYIQGFTIENVGEEIFWKAESIEAISSLSFIIGGGIMLFIAFGLIFRKKK